MLSMVKEKSYADYMYELSADDVYIGLLEHGLFGDKLPPVFTSKAFADYMSVKGNSYPKNHGCEWVTYRYSRNIGVMRDYGLPVPFAYEHLAHEIKDNWESLKFYFDDKTKNCPFRVSRIHVGKQFTSSCIFKMSYRSLKNNGNPIPSIYLGARYIVHCDISKCFQSIYTHSIPWAIMGREAAKNDQNKHWANHIDRAARMCTSKQTHGLLIGPHASNILSEIILVCVDEELVNKGFSFVRNIDDYECYAETFSQAENFIVELRKSLARFTLTLNDKKTMISKMPRTSSELWVNALTGFNFKNEKLSLSEIRSYLDLAITLAAENRDNQAIVLYACKVIANHKMTKPASEYYLSVMLHLAHLKPYLLTSLEDLVFNVAAENGCVVKSNILSNFLTLVYERAMTEKDYLSACYAVYFSIKYDFDLDNLNINNVIDTDDPLLMLFGWIYCSIKKNGLEVFLKQQALNYAKDDFLFESHWIFAYEVLNSDELPSDWKCIKKENVSFLNLDFKAV